MGIVSSNSQTIDHSSWAHYFSTLLLQGKLTNVLPNVMTLSLAQIVTQAKT